MITKLSEMQKYVLEQIYYKSASVTSDTTNKFGISRQAVLKQVRKLEDLGLIKSFGKTKARRFELNRLLTDVYNFPLNSKPNEHTLWMNYFHERVKEYPSNILEICQYGFSEIVNNAIEHSEGTEITLGLNVTAINIKLIVNDNGIGIFNKIKRELGLEDPRDAILELTKGKFTTDEEHHSGEGIFFTSRMFDDFSILSGKLFFNHKINGNDWLMETKGQIENGTSVHMDLLLSTDRTSRSVLDQFTSSEEEDFGFTKTIIPVNLLLYGEEYLVSRSQARRLLSRFEKFKKVILDFQKVHSAGRAFIDEIFRVYRTQNPDIQINWINENQFIRNTIIETLKLSEK